MPSKYEIPALRNPEGWTLNRTEWHKKWLSMFPIYSHEIPATVSEDDIANKWLNQIYQTWEGKVFFPHLSEVRKAIDMPIKTTAYADLKIGLRYILLIDRELSKIEILQRECLFQNLVWIVNYSEHFAELHEYGNITISNHSLDISTYIAKYKEIITTQQYTQYEIKIQNHIDKLLAGTSKFNKMFLESNWNDCLIFPAWEDYVRRFKYNASPLFLDTGKTLYCRKYVLDYFSPDGYIMCRPYLKKVSYSDFLNWVNRH